MKVNKQYLLKCLKVIDENEQLLKQFRMVYGTSMQLMESSIKNDMIKPIAVKLIVKLADLKEEANSEMVSNHYTSPDNYTHIDFYEEDNEEGKTVAIVCCDTLKVFFIDNTLRNNENVKDAIKEVLDNLIKKRISILT